MFLYRYIRAGSCRRGRSAPASGFLSGPVEFSRRNHSPPPLLASTSARMAARTDSGSFAQARTTLATSSPGWTEFSGALRGFLLLDSCPSFPVSASFGVRSVGSTPTPGTGFLSGAERNPSADLSAIGLATAEALAKADKTAGRPNPPANHPSESFGPVSPKSVKSLSTSACGRSCL